MPECRLDTLHFDIAASAGWYSAIAGLLAGFALLAILFPLDHSASAGDDPRVADSVVIFACAFFTLLILGFGYATLAGRPGTGSSAGVAAHQQLLLGSVFGLATLLLLFGLRDVLRTFGRNSTVFAPARGVMLATIAVFGPIVSLAFQFSNTVDIERFRSGSNPSAESCGFAGLPSGVWLNLAITVISIIGIVVLAVVRTRLPRTVTAATTVAKGTLAMVVIVTVWCAVIVPLLPSEMVTGAALEHVTLIVTGVATMIVAAAAWTTR